MSPSEIIPSIASSPTVSPATGLATQHKKQQEMIINEALTID